MANDQRIEKSFRKGLAIPMCLTGSDAEGCTQRHRALATQLYRTVVIKDQLGVRELLDVIDSKKCPATVTIPEGLGAWRDA